MTSPSVDPRIERSRRLICSAAIEEMADVGYGAMTIESIAKRAGVGKATVYRHWDGKLDLVESALDLVKDDMTVPADGSVRERLVVMLTWLAEYLASGSAGSACLPALVSAAQYDDAVRDFHHRFAARRRQAFMDVIDEGRANGELDPSLDARLVTETLVGPLFHRRMFTPDPYPADEVEAIVDLVLPA